MLAGGTAGAGMAMAALIVGSTLGTITAAPALIAVGGIFLGGYLIARGAAGLIDYFW
jgi:hypothetical protein